MLKLSQSKGSSHQDCRILDDPNETQVKGHVHIARLPRRPQMQYCIHHTAERSITILRKTRQLVPLNDSTASKTSQELVVQLNLSGDVISVLREQINALRDGSIVEDHRLLDQTKLCQYTCRGCGITQA